MMKKPKKAIDYLFPVVLVVLPTMNEVAPTEVIVVVEMEKVMIPKNAEKPPQMVKIKLVADQEQKSL
jgi:hypothetical protein